MALDTLKAELEQVLFGQEAVVNTLMATTIAGGHALFEGLPGLGKTLLAASFARAAGLSYRRVQFTPDLLPADVTGTEVLREGQFRFEKGPLFAQVVLADEINRATPKTQSALLEAMQEGAVTVGGVRYPLPNPFLVLATQNPLELEGTYPLPEAQLDRFTSKIEVRSPPRAVWQRILSEEPKQPERVAGPEDFEEAHKALEKVRVASTGHEAVINLAFLSAEHSALRFGISPRGAKSWLRLARGYAVLAGRPYVEWSDLKDAARPALVHRMFLTEEADFENVRPLEILEELLAKAMPG